MHCVRVQVTRFAAPMAYNYMHVIRMNEYLGEDRVGRPGFPPSVSYMPATFTCPSLVTCLPPPVYACGTLLGEGQTVA